MMVEVDVLFKLLFSPSQFLQSFHDRRETTDLRMGLWAKNASGQNERTVTMTVTLAANIGPKSAKVTETQTLRECSQPGQLYSIDVRSVNAEIPYADTFEVHIHYCLRAAVDDQTDVLIFAQIRFVKSVWAVVKAFIEKNAYAGLDEFAQSLYSSLLNEIKKL
ncbi:protein Aster-B isoform X2 [Drosophila ananassae]|nr:protein Aster-B isoform X2 [Drosophila ananassae]